MIRVGIVGVPGSGKTTLSRAIASKCRGIKDLRNVELVQEYARRYLSKHGNITSILEQYRILKKQQEWEDSISNDKLDIMLTDSPLFLGFIYSCNLPKRNSKEIMFFNDVFKEMIKLNYPKPRYDIIFHLLPVLKPVDDGIRLEEHFDEAWRKEADIMIKSTMIIFKPAHFYILEQKDLNTRTNFCIEKIKKHLQEKA